MMACSKFLKAGLVVFLCIAFGCSKRAYAPAHSTTTIIVDTIVEQVADSSVVRALFECDSNNRVILRDLYQKHSSNGSEELEIDSTGRVEIVTRWRTKYVDRIKELRDTVTMVEIREVEKRVRYVPRFFWYCFGFSVLSVGGIILKLFVR